MMKPKIVLLIFVSGKIVLTGAKVREEIYQAFEMMVPVLSGTRFSTPRYLHCSVLMSARLSQSLIDLISIDCMKSTTAVTSYSNFSCTTTFHA